MIGVKTFAERVGMDALILVLDKIKVEVPGMGLFGGFGKKVKKIIDDKTGRTRELKTDGLLKEYAEVMHVYADKLDRMDHLYENISATTKRLMDENARINSRLSVVEEKLSRRTPRFGVEIWVSISALLVSAAALLLVILR